MDVYKISSSDITNKPFIEYICKFNKPIILSTGASSLDEIQDAVDWISNYDNPLALLHCVLNYPTSDENANLRMISKLKEKYPDNIIGYSDHTLPKDMKVCELAAVLGSVIIEKHFTHNKALKGNDHYHAMDKNDLIAFRKNMGNVLQILGDQNCDHLSSQGLARDNARRSLVANKNLKVGEIIKYEDMTWKRPAHGISPKYLDDVVGKKIKEDIYADDILFWEMFL
jgi:N-acetylneuraminate synthase